MDRLRQGGPLAMEEEEEEENEKMDFVVVDCKVNPRMFTSVSW